MLLINKILFERDYIKTFGKTNPFFLEFTIFLLIAFLISDSFQNNSCKVSR